MCQVVGDVIAMGRLAEADQQDQNVDLVRHTLRLVQGNTIYRRDQYDIQNPDQ